jgi:hypothetical protein
MGYARMVTREEVVKEARSWVGTPAAQNQMVKGAGVDCGTYLYAVYLACGIVPTDDPHEESDPSGPVTGRYSHDWFANASSERYLRRALRYGKLIAEAVCAPSTKALPGNLVLARCVGSKYYNHGGIVVVWPRVLHCYGKVEEICVMDQRLWSYREIVILDPWAKASEAATA